MKKRGQNLIEFAAIIPLLVFVIFAIIEFSLYWKTVNIVEGIALNASTKMSATPVTENSVTNTAVDNAILLIKDEARTLGENINFEDKSQPSEISERPFALYKYESQETRNTVNGIKPVITATIDYRDPYKDGVILQLSYQYSTILLGATIPLPGNKKVVIIPKDIEITNKKTQQYNSY